MQIDLIIIQGPAIKRYQLGDEVASVPKMASISKDVFAKISKAHLLYAQEMYIARVKQYESSCKGKSWWEVLVGIDRNYLPFY